MSCPLELKISISKQLMEVCKLDGKCLNQFSISTAANGAGQLMDSNCTPTGKHVIRACIINHRTGRADVDFLLATIRSVARTL